MKETQKKETPQKFKAGIIKVTNVLFIRKMMASSFMDNNGDN